MSKLFTPLTSGPLRLQHRIVMAPLTRYRADSNFVPLPIVKGEKKTREMLMEVTEPPLFVSPTDTVPLYRV